MSDDQETKTVPTVPTAPLRDGVDAADEGGNKVIKGTKCTFSNNAEYITGKGGGVIKSPPREFIFIQRKRFTQEWPPGDSGNSPPLSTRELADHEHFPDLEEMNNAVPRDRWRMSFGQLKGPFENVQALYLLEPTTMAAYTFLTGTIGGFRAVRDLMDAIKRKRLLGSPYASDHHTGLRVHADGLRRPAKAAVQRRAMDRDRQGRREARADDNGRGACAGDDSGGRAGRGWAGEGQGG